MLCTVLSIFFSETKFFVMASELPGLIIYALSSQNPNTLKAAAERGQKCRDGRHCQCHRQQNIQLLKFKYSQRQISSAIHSIMMIELCHIEVWIPMNLGWRIHVWGITILVFVLVSLFRCFSIA